MLKGTGTREEEGMREGDEGKGGKEGKEEKKTR